MALNWFVPERILEQHFDDFFSSRNQLYTNDRDTLRAACWVVLASTPRKMAASCRDLCQLRQGVCGEELTTHCNIENMLTPTKGAPNFRIVWSRMMPYLTIHQASIIGIVGSKRFHYFKHWLALQIEAQDIRRPKKERPKEAFTIPAPELITISDLSSDPWMKFIEEKRAKEKICSPSLASQPSL